MADFTLSQKQQFFDQGWVVVPQVVPPEMVFKARYAINSTIENYLDLIQTQAHELKTDDRLTSLLMKTEAFSLIESLLGQGKVIPSEHVQCALRFPGHDPKSLNSLRPHIDSLKSTSKNMEPILN